MPCQDRSPARALSNALTLAQSFPTRGRRYRREMCANDNRAGNALIAERMFAAAACVDCLKKEVRADAYAARTVRRT
jgi:hypothetical protein